MILEGTSIRLGQLENIRVKLQEGRIFRLMSKKMIGDENFASVSDKNFWKKLNINDKIFVNYNNVSFTVKGIEDFETSLKLLQNDFPEKYQSGFKFKDSSFNLVAHYLNKGQDLEYLKIPKISPISGEFCEVRSPLPILPKSPSNRKERKNSRRSNSVYKEKPSRKVKKVIYCEVDNNCEIQSNEPLFIFKEKKTNMEESIKEETDLNESSLTPKDLNNLNWGSDYNVNFFVIPYVQDVQAIREIKELLGFKANFMNFLAMIQDEDGINNIDEILEEVDGIVWARGYIAVHIPIEKLYCYQQEIINKCYSKEKIILIYTQLLESMVDIKFPTCSEVSDISNLVNQNVDGFILTNEVAFGHHPIETMQTLNRIIIEGEYRQIQSFCFHEFTQNIISLPKTITNCVAFCSLHAVHSTQAKLLIVFSQKGKMAKRFSRANFPCPILAVTDTEEVARYMTGLLGVIAIKFGSLVGGFGLIPKAIEEAKRKKLVVEGDYIVSATGDKEILTGSTNTVKIHKI